MIARDVVSVDSVGKKFLDERPTISPIARIVLSIRQRGGCIELCAAQP